ncbi:outer membrane protein, adhesin transport system [Pseudomonas abietaniphila]|uniref:Outer membrane protein, adhesin transport system n=2 Tax=Pseudomonas abietaniphila TaxID=89065 RepID=A0A1G7RYJ5_9PSED|nr:TolC family outer membrane protein [Pseudomonas abietaniphila]SDG15826.1 outer membrane protein, adhesin transport system [Pseudomonas abietaniphila]
MKCVRRHPWPMVLLTIGLQHLIHLPAQADEYIDPGLRSISPSRLQHQPGDKQPKPRSSQSPVAAVPGKEDTQTLGLEQAVRLAVDWHPSISEAIGTLYQQAEGINVAEAGYYPQIAGGIKGGYNSGYGSDASSQSVSISLKQMLYDFGKVSNAVEAARAKAARSQASILLAIDQVGRDTAFAYVEVQRYQRLIDIARQQIQGIGGIVDLAKQRSDMGASTRSDVVQAQSRAEGGMATLQEYKAQYARWQATLGNLLGRQTSPQVTDAFPDSLNQSCNTPVITDALPAVLQAAAQRTQAQAELAQAKAEAYPTLSLEPSFNQYLDNNYDSQNPAIDRTQVGIFLNLEVPIYQGGAISARSRAAGYALTAADAAEDAARLQARQGLSESQAQTSGLTRRLNSLEFRETTIKEARELYGRQYLELGTRPLLDLLNAEQEIHQSRFDLANTQADLRRLQIDCLYNSGALRRAFGIDHSTIQHVEILP